MQDMPSNAAANSPCIGVCQLDKDTGFCLGCLRTADEIGAWRDASAAFRREILMRIQQRRRHARAPKARSVE